MAPRTLTSFEFPIASSVERLGTANSWEFAAFLESPTGPLIEIKTMMLDDRCDPSSDVHNAATNGKLIVVHHNHLSQESLSFPDWCGLSKIFDETFAHCADGTVYWGRVRDKKTVLSIIQGTAQTVQMNAETELFKLLNGGPNAVDLASFFRKEVVNRAMLQRGIVEYEYSWGTGSTLPYVRPGSPPCPCPAGICGAALN